MTEIQKAGNFDSGDGELSLRYEIKSGVKKWRYDFLAGVIFPSVIFSSFTKKASF